MANYTVQELLAWMDGKSKTYGWDAIVAYDRRKTNTLLHQQYVERFNSESYIPSITIGLSSSVYTTEYLYGLKLSVPKLSFANANLSSSRADLTMDMVGGLIVTKLAAAGLPPRVDSIKQVLPLGGPQLTMTLPLENTQGTVNERQVTLNIAAGEDFRANFVIGDLAQETVGLMFKTLFQSLTPKQKIFSLGGLSGELNDVLTPESFQIRTMASPSGDRKADVDYGNGGVLMFIQFKGGSVGDIPPMPQPGNPDGFRYPIPRADGLNNYSGTMLLSSQVLFKKILSPYLTKTIGKGLAYKVDPSTSDRASTLEAISGTTDDTWSFYFKCLTTPGGQPSNLRCSVTNFRIPLSYQASNDVGHRVYAQNSWLTISWNGSLVSTFRPFPENQYWTDVYFDLNFTGTLQLQAKIEGERGIVKLTPNSFPTFPVHVNPHDANDMPWNRDLKEVSQSQISAKTIANVWGTLNSIDIPGIDTFLARNLLFNGHDALQLLNAHVPGDLAMFGHIDPVRTSMTLTPSQSLIEAGKEQQFDVYGDGISNILWSVQDTDGDIVDVGTISASGLYRAPALSALGKGYVTVLITAEGSQNNQPVKASALVSIIDGTIAVNPIFQVLAPGHETSFSASTIDGSAPEWTLLKPELGATLTPDPVNPHHRTFKAGPKGSDAFTLDMIQVQATNGSPKVLKILVPNFSTALMLKVADSSNPASGEVKLQVLINDEVLDPEEYTLTLLDGGGELDVRTGIYKEPASDKTSFAIITARIGRGSLGHYGFLALLLPLSRYSNTPRMFDEHNPSAAWGDAGESN
ncbi:hypothetical protein [Pseudomonas sp. FW300-N1A1]|uniref:hypothetical protein n=1 Tax=Pseudomonas sp. FW300-N1A1 TaxID=2075555 RepID=UPI0011AF80F2|nr:hypothetical protein [Pseudomonas sp. FW300-N1A1]